MERVCYEWRGCSWHLEKRCVNRWRDRWRGCVMSGGAVVGT